MGYFESKAVRERSKESTIKEKNSTVLGKSR